MAVFSLGIHVRTTVSLSEPKASLLWYRFHVHFDHFESAYLHDYQSRCIVLCGVIPEVVEMFMGCRDFDKSFVRLHCDEYSHEYLLITLSKVCWFCPLCHQKKVQIFDAMLSESILAEVPHLHFTSRFQRCCGCTFDFIAD